MDLPGDVFTWVGYDGSEIVAQRAPEMYGSFLGRADEKARQWLANKADEPVASLLWGVGNHGGGPSYADLKALGELIP